MTFYDYMDLNNYFEKHFYSISEYKEELKYFVNNEHNKNISYSFIILGYLFEQCGCYLNANKNYLKAYILANKKYKKNKKKKKKHEYINKYTALTYMTNNKYKNLLI